MSDAFDREQQLDEIRRRMHARRQQAEPFCPYHPHDDSGECCDYAREKTDQLCRLGVNDAPRIPIPREPGPQALAAIVWTFQLGARDAALMLRALGGRLADDDDRAAASLLCDRLTLQRERQLLDSMKTYTIAAEHVRAKGQP